MQQHPIYPPDDLVVSASRHRQPDAYVLALHGSAGAWNQNALDQAFGTAAASGHPLIVDLSGLVSGDEILLALLLTARATTGITLIGPLTGPFRQRLTITGTDQAFTIHPDLAHALAGLPR